MIQEIPTFDPDKPSQDIPVFDPNKESTDIPMGMSQKPPSEVTVSAAKRPEQKYRYTTDPIGMETKVPRDPTRAEWMDFYKFDKDAPKLGAKVRAAAATGKISDVKTQIAKELGVDEKDIQISDAEGVGPVYKTKGMEKFAPVDPIGLDFGDVIEGALDLGPAISGAGAGIVSGAYTKSPVAAGSAAAGASTTVKAGQLTLLKQLGILDITPEEIAVESLKEGSLEIIGAGAPSLFRKAVMWLPLSGSAKKRVVERLTRDIDPDDLAKGRVEADRIADLVEEETGFRPNYTTGEQMALVEPERAGRIKSLEEISETSIEAARSQRIAGEKLQAKIEPTVEKEFLEVEAAAGVKEVAEPKWKAAEKSIEDTTEKTIKKLELRKSALPQTETGEAGESIRVALEEGNEQAYKPLRKAYDEFDAEFAEIPVDTKSLKDAAKELEKETVIFPEWAADSRAAIRQAKKTGAATFSNVQTALSDIRSKLRVMEKEGASISEINKVKRIRNSLKGSRDDALQKMSPERAEEMLALEDAYAKYKRATSEGVIGSVMKKTGGRYTVADTNILNNMIRNADDVRTMKQISIDHPDLNVLPQMREALMVKYRKTVIDGGGSPKKFIDAHKTAMDELLTAKERAMMSSASRAKTAIPEALKREKKLLKDLKEYLPEYKLSQFESNEVMSKMQGDVMTANRVKGLLAARHPDKWKVVQEARKKQISDKSETISGLETVLNNEKSELIVTLGRPYVKTLETALEVAKSKSKAVAGEISEGKVKEDIAIAQALVFGPLSRFGFVKSVAGQVGREKYKKITRELIRDSKMLEDVIRAHSIKNDRRRMIAIANATGISLMMQGPQEEASEYKEEK
jgi:hypothetical protein